MSPARAAALDVLVRVERDRAHAAPLVDARARRMPPREGALLRALVRTTLRHALRLDHVLARSLDRPVASLEAPVRAALRLGAAQLLLMDRVPPHAAVGETVAALKAAAPRAAGLANAVLRRVAATEERPGRVDLGPGAGPIERLSVETSHPLWLVRRWVDLLGEPAARAALEADNADTPVEVLLDPRGEPAADVVARLAAEGLPLEKVAWAPLAYRVAGREAGAHPAIRSGAVAVVDSAAQAMAELVPPADVVVDLAAAPGGKTRCLLATGRARRVVALERHPRRAFRLASNLSSAGRRDEVLAVVADAGRPPLARGRAASVLLDAPCSGTGTLRKSPEIRWRLRPEDLRGFAEVQERLLDAALDLCAPGGTVVYVTCSLEPEENEEVVARVLGRRADAFRARPDAGSLPDPLGAAERGTGLFRVAPGPWNDGFTASVLRRAPGAR